jgi:hypothetical protein
MEGENVLIVPATATSGAAMTAARRRLPSFPPQRDTTGVSLIYECAVTVYLLLYIE